MHRASASILALAATLIAATASAQSAPAPTYAPPPTYAPAPAAPQGAWAPPGQAAYAPRPALQTYAPAPGYYGGYAGYAPPPVVWGSEAAEPGDDGGRRSPALMATGFSMVGVGAIALSFGIFFHVIESSIQYETDCIDPCGYAGAPTSTHSTGSTAAMIAGGALMAVGLPLGIYGSIKRPTEASASASASASAPSVAVGPTSARLRWAF